MIKVRVSNKMSERWNQEGIVTAKDWAAGHFWVSVKIAGQEFLIARVDLREC